MRQFLSREDESKLVKGEEGEKETASHSENRERISERRPVKVVLIMSPISLGERLTHLSTKGIVG